MKILQVVHGFPPENIAGTEVYTYNLAKALKKNHEIFVFYRTADFSKKEYVISRREEEGLKLFSINNTFRDYTSFESTYKDGRLAEKFGQVLDEIKPDIVHVQHLLYLSTKMIEEVKMRGIPVVFTLNDFWLLCPQGQLFKGGQTVCEGADGAECLSCVLYQLGIRKNVAYFYAMVRKFTPGWFFQVAKNLYLLYAKTFFLRGKQVQEPIHDRINWMKEVCSKIDLFIAPSEFIRRRFVAFGVPEARIKFSAYGFDTQKITVSQKPPAKLLRFGFIGTLMPAKGAHVLIRSFREIESDRAELRIYGKAFSYKSALGDYVGRIKAEAGKKNIKFLGGFAHADINRIFKEIDVLVVPSIWYENAPLVIQEAFLARIPVIASRIGGIPELIRDGDNGFLFDAGDSKGLKEKLEYVISHPEVLNKFRTLVPTVKNLEENAEEVAGVYRQLLYK
ncbi:MAG: glycosyltransferase family 4 protein [Candidatus Paceibacterota bacterium]|jgi:glycosyltransferase involved in cell wall biosynthesis